MAKVSKPSVTLKCPANVYSASNERIVEVNANDGSGQGCLISVQKWADGRLVVSVYRADEGVQVSCDPWRVVGPIQGAPGDRSTEEG